jgi:DNA invertase Pin-like site-specific DNA recombinase
MRGRRPNPDEIRAILTDLSRSYSITDTARRNHVDRATVSRVYREARERRQRQRT